MSGQSALESDVSPHFKAQPTMSLVISNVAGKNNGPGTYKRRKKAIAGMLKKISTKHRSFSRIFLDKNTEKIFLEGYRYS